MRLINNYRNNNGQFNVNKDKEKKRTASLEPSRIPLGASIAPQSSTFVAPFIDPYYDTLRQGVKYFEDMVQAQKDAEFARMYGDPMATGSAKIANPMEFVSPSGDVVSMLEGLGMITNGDPVAGAAQLALGAASVFLPGTIKIPDYFKHSPNPEVLEEVLTDISKGNYENPMDLLEGLDENDIVDVISGAFDTGIIMDQSVQRNVDDFISGLREYAEMTGDDNIADLLFEGMQNSLERNAKNASEYYKSPEGKQAFRERVINAAKESGQYVAGETEKKADEALKSIENTLDYYELVDVQDYYGQVTKSIKENRNLEMYDRAFGPFARQDLVGPIKISEANLPSSLGRTIWHEAGHAFGDMSANAMNQDRAVSSIIPTWATVNMNKSASSGKPLLPTQQNFQQLSDDVVKKADEFFENMKKMGIDVAYAFDRREISRYGSEIRGFAFEKYGIGPTDKITEEMVIEFMNTHNSRIARLYPIYVKKVLDKEPSRVLAQLANSVPAIAAVGGAAAIMSQQNNQQNNAQ